MSNETTPIDTGGLIARSWQRCVASGMDRGQRLPEPVLAGASLAERLEANARLVAYAGPLVDGLAGHLADSPSVVLLADSQGIILHSAGDEGFLERAGQVRLSPGAIWSETEMGTNAIGTALVEQRTVEVVGGQHYLERNHFLTCISTPILAPGGGILGLLDISSDIRLGRAHSGALLEMTAGIIENRLISTLPEAAVVLHLHTVAEALGSPMEGVAAFSEDGRLLAANRRFAGLLAMDGGKSFADWFATPWGGLIDYAGRRGEEIFSLPSRGRHFMARASLRLAAGRRAAAAGKLVSSGDSRNLDELGADDTRMAEAIRRARRIAECDIPLLIQGETGSGKEWFARAFHNSSTRREGPFVAVNCAAIPHTLIEAELFGYVDGAFTGARRIGARGKIREADGGTLFLDEIGDMPLPLQAVLLRVLETRRVTPLGGSSEEAVDIMLVCASHQQLRDLVGSGQFRADLFFRLSGMTVSLPPLRERSDFDRVVRRILVEESPLRPVRVAPEAAAVLKRYSWPGNLRQLRNVLRLTVALLGEDGLLTADLLPPELRDGDGARTPAEVGLRAAQSRLVREAVERHGGNISAAARELGITRTTLYRKLAAERQQGK